MSSEVSQQQSSVGSNLASYALMPGITAACSAGSALKTHGIKGLKASYNSKGFEKLEKALKKEGVDVFTRSQAVAKAYDGYKDIAKANAKAIKTATKAEKLAAKGAKGRLSVKNHARNFFAKYIHDPIFKNNQWGVKSAQDVKGAANAAKTNAKDALDIADKALDAGKINLGTIDDELKLTSTNANAISNAVESVAKEAGESALKSGAKGFGKSVASNFKNELGWKNGKFNYFMTALQFIPNIKNEVIPAFKEEGFWGGLKATGKTLVRAAADLVGYSAGGSVGRVIGSTIGMLIPFVPKGVGARIGGNLGDIIGSMIVGNFVTKTVDKAVGADKEIIAQEMPQAVEVQEQAEITPAQEAQIAQMQQQVPSQDENKSLDVSAQYAHLPSKAEVKQLAFQRTMQKNPQLKYYA